VTVAVAVIVLIAAVIAGAAQGIRIGKQVQEFKIEATNVPSRKMAYPELILDLPTVVGSPEASGRVGVLGAPLATVVTHTLLRSGPGTKYAIISELPAGEEVRMLASPIEVEGRKWQWVKAEGNDRVGWCMPKVLKATGARE
jgi:uncharacterized protein YgiM (DUF1202 family)